ncbi:MAG: hypothetical protein H7249_13405 [Chitinophagaceae bacterium]|nr:hypothetical protein [Oligoflexus sp.]
MRMITPIMSLALYAATASSIANAQEQVVSQSATQNHTKSDELSFHNIFTLSRTVISSSQYYQLKSGSLIEAIAGFTAGTSQVDTALTTRNEAVKGSNLAAGAFYALSPIVVLGVNAKYNTIKVTNVIKNDNTLVSPSITVSPFSFLSLGLQANFIRGHEKAAGQPSQKPNAGTLTLGLSAHQEMWEATAVVTSKHKDLDNPSNNQPQDLGFHARYRIDLPITLGVSYDQKDYSSFHENGIDLKNEATAGVHMESAMSESFSIEVDYFATTSIAGVKNHDGTEFVLLGQALVSDTVEAGASLSYRTTDGKATNVNTTNPSLFVAAHF